jgi:anti-sigma28 factor (negative regulator of flagellin synthesis)
MKIQGPRHGLNIYQQNKQLQLTKKKHVDKDQLYISGTAKQLQVQQEKLARADYVEETKAKIAGNQYEMNYDQLAEKLIHAWKLDKSGKEE